MANSSVLMVTFCFFLTSLIISFSNIVIANGNHVHELNWIPTTSRCQGSTGECMIDEDEFDMESEINRRILATQNYISYGALQRNTVPCSQRGASYYNCKAGAQANPYNRGCSAITRCRS